MQRRAFLTGLLAAVTAPAIVRAGMLMPIKQMVQTPISLRIITAYVPGDQAIDRLDILFGSMRAKPEWLVAYDRAIYDHVVSQSEQTPDIFRIAA